MPSFSSKLALTLFLLSTSTSVLGRVVNFTAPDTVQAGTNLTAVLQIQNYISNWDDFGVIWGLKQVDDQYTSGEETVGYELSYDNLYPITSDELGNRTVSVPIPEGQQAGDYFLVAAIPYLAGVSGETGIRYFNQSLAVTD